MSLPSDVKPDPADPRVTSGEAFERVCDALRASAQRVLGPGAPEGAGDRAEGFRYLLRFLAAGTRLCVEHADPDRPELTRMLEPSMRWGLDAPDCLYLYASLRGDATYRISGRRGSAHHLDVQVNHGHFASGEIASWGTIDSLSGLELEVGADGRFALWIGGEPRPRNWLCTAANAEFVLVRQYFNDWEREGPGDLRIERVGAVGPAPRLRSDELGARLDRLVSWLEQGGALWERMSRGCLELPPNTLQVHLPAASSRRAGMRGQAYGLGNFECARGEAVIVEFEPPPCHYWSVSLASYWWESLDYATRQSSLNGHQARLDPDGAFRGVIAHEDPGVANWLDPAGHERGTLALRCLRAERAPLIRLRRVPLAELESALPRETARVDPTRRLEILEGRRRAVLRRYRC